MTFYEAPTIEMAGTWVARITYNDGQTSGGPLLRDIVEKEEPSPNLPAFSEFDCFLPL